MKRLVLPKSSGFRPLHFKLLTSLLFVLGCAHAVAQISGLSGYELRSPEWPNKDVHETVQLAGQTFSVPHSMVERPQELQPNASAGEVALRVLWPDMTGYRKRLADFFRDKRHEREFIDLAFKAKRNGEGMSEHLDTVYKRLARGATRQGPEGLRILTLSGDNAPYLDQVFYEPGLRNGFVARCRTRQTNIKIKSSRAVSTCRRTIKIADGLLLSYAFPRKLLSDWIEMDTRTRALYRDLRKTAAEKG